MGLLTVEERDRLLLYLSRLPGIQSEAVRNALLSGVPTTVRNQIQAVGIPAADLSAMIDTIDSDALQLADGSWPIERVITNAADRVDGTITAEMLRQLLAQARARQAGPPQAAAPAAGPAGAAPRFNTNGLRNLLSAALSDSDLTTLAFDYFRPVYEDFGPGMAKSMKIQALVDYCDRNGLLPELVSRLAQANPYQYERFKSQLSQ